MAKIIIPDITGHKTIEYDKTNPQEVQRADTLLQKTLRAGALAYRSDTMQQVHGVEPGVEETIVVPQIMGG